MLRGEAPTAEEARAFEVAMILHAEHEMNASTFTARVVAGTNADMHSAIVAAICALKGPLHGGANQAAMRMLEEFGSLDRVADGVRGAARGEAAAVRLRPSALPRDGPAGADPARGSPSSSRTTASRATSRSPRPPSARRCAQKGLWPNVDLYSGVLYHALGIPTDLFIPLFEMSRVVGQARTCSSSTPAARSSGRAPSTWASRRASIRSASPLTH